LHKQGKIIWQLQLRSRRPPGRYALVHLRNPLRALALLGQHRAPENCSPRFPKWKPLVGCEGNGCSGLLLRCLSFPAQLMEPGSKGEGKSEAKGVRQLLGEGERIVDTSQGLLRIAEIPQRPGSKGEAVHPGVIAIEKGVGAILLGIVERNALLQVCTGA